MALEKTINFLSDTLSSLHMESCELLYEEERRGLTRFARDQIHQSAETEVRGLTVRCIEDGQVGLVRTTCFDRETLMRAAKQAVAMARQLSPATVPKTLPAGHCSNFQGAHDEQTARVQPFERAQLVRNMLDWKGKTRSQLSGSVMTSRQTMCVVSTRGMRVFEERTRVDVNLVAEGPNGTGRSYWAGWRMSDVPLRRLLDEALAEASTKSRRGKSVDGRCRVVLDYLAAGQLLGFLGYLGFGAKSFIEKCSFLVEELGKPVAASMLTVLEDPLAMVPVGHDFEGMPRKRVTLMHNGVATGFVTDSFTAMLLGRENTGHAPQPDSTEGPLPTHLVVGEGTMSLEELCAAVGEGIYVRDLHYVNVVEPISTTITGTTRHGTWLIRGGELVEPLPELRFQVRILDVLKGLLGIGKKGRPADGACGLVHTPPLASECFEIVGAAGEN
ncbi:MAG: TldD/PmbA family protein [Candidatus Sumerlaeaceae bacterium]